MVTRAGSLGFAWLLAACLLAAGCQMTPFDPHFDGADAVVRGVIEPFHWAVGVSKISPGLSIAPGDTWGFDFEVEVDLRRYEAKQGKFTHLIVALRGERRYDREGFYRSGASTFALSSNFTTTGIPVERYDGWPRFKLLHGKDGSPFEAVKSFALDAGEPTAKVHHLAGHLDVRVPVDVPQGHYDPCVYVLVRVEGVKHPVHLAMFGYEWNDELSPPSLPLLKVGEAATPKVPWAILTDFVTMGRAGTLPEEYRGKVQLCSRSGFPSELILPPSRYEITPSFPSVFPRDTLAPVDGGMAVIPAEHVSYLKFADGKASCIIDGPQGTVDLGTKRFIGQREKGPMFERGGFSADMRRTGRYLVHLNGTIGEQFGRQFEGGGTYVVNIANPLTFSTSCKPGSGFLVGNGYPAKVNVIPPFPAAVEVKVEYYPDSDASRKITWVGEGHANRFGHFTPHGVSPLIFDEPGEYKSTVTARFVDNRENLWMGRQVSVGVVAPNDPTLVLHGVRSFPYNNRMNLPYNGGVKRYVDRQNIAVSLMPETPYLLQDPFAPYDPRDTLFIPSNFSCPRPGTKAETDRGARAGLRPRAGLGPATARPLGIFGGCGSVIHGQLRLVFGVRGRNRRTADYVRRRERLALFLFPGKKTGGGLHHAGRRAPRFSRDDLGLPDGGGRPVLVGQPE